MFTACCEPYLASEYGGDYDTDSPVKLLDRLLYGLKQRPGQQVVLLSQVSVERSSCRPLCFGVVTLLCGLQQRSCDNVLLCSARHRKPGNICALTAAFVPYFVASGCLCGRTIKAAAVVMGGLRPMMTHMRTDSSLLGGRMRPFPLIA